ncbi:hypothetical protein HA402_006195 [Bradysia odoriphaga]|nr:hypothetical protein HA402_006195 [Bradysia odoriphaga]
MNTMKEEEENEAIERENRQKSYVSTIVPRKPSGVWKLLGICVGAIVGICCCVACVAALQSNNNDPPLNGAATVPYTASPQDQITSVVSSNNMRNQSSFTPNANNNFSNLAASPLQRDSRSDLPLTPRRQDSLPSYEDAVKMARPID